MAGGDLRYVRTRDRNYRTVCHKYDPWAALLEVSSEQS